MIKHICFILLFYPTEDNYSCIFAKKLIYAIAAKGVKCTVISPQMILPRSVKKRYPFHRIEKTMSGQEIEIFMPYYLYLTSRRCAMKISMKNHYSAVLRVLNKYHLHPDAVYGHFLFQCGLTASRIGKKFHIPAYCACGENSTRLAKDSQPYHTGLQYGGWEKIINDLSGIISVSNYNKRLLVENGFASPDMKIGVFPNGVDLTKFRKMDKTAIRKTLNIPEDKFIIAFNGAYSERKGFPVLCKALNKCENVFSIFIGSDTVNPPCKNILFSGRLKPEQVPQYLNCADVFVLPTIGEGCCNAILEALACGLPVISSDLPFNDDILDESDSIRVAPLNDSCIKDAIERLQKDPDLRIKMSENAENQAKKFDIEKRANLILRFMGMENVKNR